MSSRNKKYINWGIALLALLLLLFAIVSHSLSIGELNISFLDAISTLFDTSADSLEATLIKKVRLPRIVLGIAVGGSLSLAGLILQGIYRNPLVEPFTLGISGGASLGVALCIVLGLQATLGVYILPVFGFAGALASIFIVYSLSSHKAGINTQRMLLIGVMVSFIASSGIMFLMSITTSENLQGIIFWTMGSLSESNSSLVYGSLIISILALIGSYLFVQPLNALRLGEERAKHLGINTNRTVKYLFIIASLLTGLCVSVAGVIGFVGLIIPHILRTIFGTDYRVLLASSFILGACFLVGSDTIARTIILPNELPIGVITGLVGGIAFIFIMSKNNKA